MLSHAFQAALGQEQQERAASLASMRNTLAALSTSGVTEERLKEELIRSLEANARTTSSLVGPCSTQCAAHSNVPLDLPGQAITRGLLASPC
jgi:hypothetical protein